MNKHTPRELLLENDRPNCVSSLGTGRQFFPPWGYSVTSAQAKRLIADELQQIPRAQIVAEEHNYLHATFTSKLFKFVDDVEFVIDDASKFVHFRSRSRVGYYDLGANKKRMVDLKHRLAGKLLGAE